MKKNKLLSYVADIIILTIGCAMIAFATYNVALYADFPLAGFSGIAFVLYHFWKLPIGLTVLVMNIPLAILCLKRIGPAFMIKTGYCMIISTILLDEVMPLLPVYNGDLMLCALSTGVLSGVGYALVYTRSSSTGGTDFITMLAKARWPHLKLSTVIMISDITVIVVSGLLYSTVDHILFGVIIDVVMTTVIDRFILGLNSGNVALIVVDEGKGKEIADLVEEKTDRGATILDGRGGRAEEGKDVVMVAGYSKDIYQVQKVVKAYDPSSFIIILDSKEVHGEGFDVTTVAGEDAAK